MLSLQRLTTSEPRMATLTVRNLDEVLVRRLRVRAAENGRSAEAEHREILRAALEGREGRVSREEVASRLAEFRRRTAGRGSPSSAELLEETRRSRAEALVGPGDGA
jgi:plasmid stability protein